MVPEGWGRRPSRRRSLIPSIPKTIKFLALLTTHDSRLTIYTFLSFHLPRRNTTPLATASDENASVMARKTPRGPKSIEQATGDRFYFATPHHAWERGTNETPTA